MGGGRCPARRARRIGRQRLARPSAASGQTRVNGPVSPGSTGNRIEERDFHSDFTQEDFEASVEKIREYVLAGDVMQTVLSRRMSVAFEAPPLNLYRALRCLNPSPYMYFLNLRDFHIVGSSPEILARVEDEEVMDGFMPGEGEL